MHIPIKVDYGVRALVDLALHVEDQPIRASEIAGRTLIPEPYLAQVMHALGKGGMVRSQRGPLGGHALAMEPKDIRLSMVMDCLGSTENWWHAWTTQPRASTSRYAPRKRSGRAWSWPYSASWTPRPSTTWCREARRWR